MKKIKVLSLFDGISCGQVALKSLGYDVEYYASEIDKYAIEIANKNHPETIQLGDVRQINYNSDMDYLYSETAGAIKSHYIKSGIDLLIGGSPCQGFSFAGKQLNFEDPRSALFFEFVRILKEVKPKYFLLENVKMKQEFQDIISEQLGVKPIEINSNLVSAQNRRRLYWTNIPNIEQPEDREIFLKDIIHEGEGVLVKNQGKDFRENINKKASCLMARDYKGFGNQEMTGVIHSLKEYIVPFDKTLQILDKEVQKGKVGYFRKDSQANRVYHIHDKAITLCGEAGGGAAKMGQYLFGCITPDRINKRQNGQRFSLGKKFYTLTAQDRHGILIEGYIRKLTPIECERLQTMSDNYTEGISNTQRYKALGNGWTVDVIKHIFSYMK